MIQISLIDILIRAVSSLLTLYMMMILIRWTGAWLEVDLFQPRLRWICRVTDPLIDAMRRVLPPMGPVDFGPIAALFVVWVVRYMSLSVLAGIGAGGKLAY